MDASKQSELAAITSKIEAEQSELVELVEKRGLLAEEQKTLMRRVAVASKLSSKIENFRKQHSLFLKDVEPECTELGIVAGEVVRMSITTDKLAEIERVTAERNAAVTRDLDESVPDSLAAGIRGKSEILGELHEALDAPNRQYQENLASLATWDRRRMEIVGDKDTPGSHTHIRSRLDALAEVPASLAAKVQLRKAKAREIFEAIKSLVTLYKTLYKPVQDFIEHHPLAHQGFQLDFEVRIVSAGFENGFFGFVSQQKRGSFCGVEEGRQALKGMLDSTDWNDPDGTFAFLDEIIGRLSHDYRQPSRPEVVVRDQLKREGGSLIGLYDFLFDLDYLKPKYDLQWGGRELDELSPGERGTVLLLFYLLVDGEDIPLVIDQPEENLDNQTVFNILVPAIKEARNRRQIVVVTHNPNLAVVCDADQVIYAHLDKQDGNRVTYTAAAIEEPVINRKIVDVLEGTRPAFDNRKSKYQTS